MEGGEATEAVTLVGNLCTGTDVIAEDLPMPHLECGDLIVSDRKLCVFSCSHDLLVMACTDTRIDTYGAFSARI